jgi:hypothetical protein
MDLKLLNGGLLTEPAGQNTGKHVACFWQGSGGSQEKKCLKRRDRLLPAIDRGWVSESFCRSCSTLSAPGLCGSENPMYISYVQSCLFVEMELCKVAYSDISRRSCIETGNGSKISIIFTYKPRRMYFKSEMNGVPVSCSTIWVSFALLNFPQTPMNGPFTINNQVTTRLQRDIPLNFEIPLAM